MKTADDLCWNEMKLLIVNFGRMIIDQWFHAQVMRLILMIIFLARENLADSYPVITTLYTLHYLSGCSADVQRMYTVGTGYEIFNVQVLKRNIPIT